MKQKKESAEKTVLGNELDSLLGSGEFKKLGEDLAFVIAKHGLSRRPDICKKVFLYMISVTEGWNPV